VKRLYWLTFLLTLGGCAGLSVQRLQLPDRYTLVRDQLAIHGDFPLAAHHRLFEELTAQRTDLFQRLALKESDEPIDVYLFESSERFDQFMRLHHPRFPERRAFFIETDSRLSVYAHWGDRMAEDLRHETCHAYIHSVVPRVPVWLDEGIAEYYEAPLDRRGLNQSHLDRLLVRIQRENWRPDLRRLEGLADPSMDQDDYAESWAWVHFLFESSRESVEILREYLADFHQHGDPSPLSARLGVLASDPNAALVEWITRNGGSEPLSTSSRFRYNAWTSIQDKKTDADVSHLPQF
jgi:hypothetical protein